MKIERLNRFEAIVQKHRNKRVDRDDSTADYDDQVQFDKDRDQRKQHNEAQHDDDEEHTLDMQFESGDEVRRPLNIVV